MAEANGRIEVFMLGFETATPTLSDTGLFLYDFSTLYELAILAVDPRYESYPFSRYSLYRHNRPVSTEQRLQVASIRQQSPLEVAATIAAYGTAGATVMAAFWALAQLVGYTYNFPLNRRKLELEVAKLEKESAGDAQSAGSSVVTPSEAVDRLATKALPLVETTARRLARSPIQLVDIDVRPIGETPDIAPRLIIRPEVQRPVEPPREGEAS
jgi:hypothetical protein